MSTTTTASAPPAARQARKGPGRYDAVTAAKQSGGNGLPPDGLKALEQAGYTAALDNFLHELLSQNPEVPFWTYYASIAAKAGQTDRMLALARATLERQDLGAASKASLQQNLYAALLAAEVPAHWLRDALGRQLTEGEKARVAALGGWEALMETLRRRLEEQQARHEGGSRWIGSGGTSPFGAHGYNPEGIRLGGRGGSRRAVKVWDRREFRNLDDTVELGTRNIKLALRRLRRWAREGAAEELDLGATIRRTAEQGWLDVITRPERHNAVKVLLFLDAGGSMDSHVRVVEELFSAARSEFTRTCVTGSLRTRTRGGMSCDLRATTCCGCATRTPAATRRRSGAAGPSGCSVRTRRRLFRRWSSTIFWIRSRRAGWVRRTRTSFCLSPRSHRDFRRSSGWNRGRALRCWR